MAAIRMTAKAGCRSLSQRDGNAKRWWTRMARGGAEAIEFECASARDARQGTVVAGAR
jgi:hypothetical protein